MIALKPEGDRLGASLRSDRSGSEMSVFVYGTLTLSRLVRINSGVLCALLKGICTYSVSALLLVACVNLAAWSSRSKPVSSTVPAGENYTTVAHTTQTLLSHIKTNM